MLSFWHMKHKAYDGTVLFFHSPQRRYYPEKEKLAGIYRFARARNWRVQILEAPADATEARTLVRSWQPIGCLVDMDASRRLFTTAALGGTPTVFLDFDDRLLGGRSFRVNHDPVAVAALAAKRLGALGLTHYAFIGYSRKWTWSDARRDAFRNKLGRKAESFSSFTFPAAKAADTAKRAAFDIWLGKLPKPCGIMLANDYLAEELYPACKRLGIAIPADVSVMGVDDDETFCANLNPTLTSIRLDFNQAGWWLAELLDRRIQDPTLRPHVRTYHPIGISPRNSTLRVASAPDRIVVRLSALLREKACSHVNIPEILSEFGLSRRSIELRYRAATGTSILKTLRDIRFARACELLRDRSIPLSDIPFRCGYASPAHLLALFKSRTGLTMSRWRARNPKA